MTPESSAAQNGWMKMFALVHARPRAAATLLRAVLVQGTSRRISPLVRVFGLPDHVTRD